MTTQAQLIKLEPPSKAHNESEAHQLTVLTEGDDEEVSYVLLVEGDGDEEEEDEDFGTEPLTSASANAQDLKVFDFEEEPNLKPKTEVVSGAQDESSMGPVEGGTEGNDGPAPPNPSPKKKSTSTNQHMCNYCNYTSPKRYLLSRHLKSHSEERPHKCSVCERGFKTLASLQNHVNTHTGTKPHKCKYCESAFTTSGELVRHVRYRHTHEKPHHCTECDYSSVELSKLKRHMRCHTGERPYQCPHCTYASPDTFKLKRHLRIHTGEKPYSCDICGARFTQSNSLKAHRLIHTGQKPVFKCDLCPATCGRKTDLRIHVQKLHTSDKPLKCKRCGKTFPDRYNFKLHCKSHEGEKCFKCDLCAYASTSQRHLESHMLVHTDQKPWGCEFCDQSFRQKQLLRRHQNLYHNPNYIPPTPRDKQHECSECGRTFRHKGNLIRHMAIHDPESSVHERPTTIKTGRQAKRTLQMMSIDGQTVEVINDEDEDEDGLLEGEDGTTQMIAVEGEDGQQYVVLEVIQLQDSDPSTHVSTSSAGSTQQITLVTSNSNVNRSDGTSTPMTLADLQQLVVGEQHEEEGEYLIEDPGTVDPDAETQHLDQDPSSSLHQEDSGLVDTKFLIKQEIVSESDVKTCFGFDDSDDDLMDAEGTEDAEMLEGESSYF